MPGIERDLLDQPLAGAAVRRVDVLLGDRQPRHRNRRRDLLGPLDRSILDRCSRRVHVRLDAELEHDVTVPQAPGDLPMQVIRIRRRRVGGVGAAGYRPQQVSDRAGIGPKHRASAPVGLERAFQQRGR